MDERLVSCQEIRPYLTQKVDEGSLPPEVAPQVEAHLKACSRCTAFLEDEKRLKSRVRQALRSTATAPPAILFPPRPRRKLPAFAAGLFLGIALTLAVPRLFRSEPLWATYEKVAAGQATLHCRGSHCHPVGARFLGEERWHRMWHRRQAKGLKLVGMRIVHRGDQPVLCIFYRYRGVLVMESVFPSSVDELPPKPPRINWISWVEETPPHGRFRCLLMAPLPPRELQQLL